jgi:signal transduction histidine kinase
MKSKKGWQANRKAWRKQVLHHDRPHWWPEDEPWPPSRYAWRQNRKRLFPRAIFGAVFALTMSTLLCSGAIYLLQTLVMGLELPLRPATLMVGLGMIFLILLAGVLGRNLRRFFSPLDDLLEGAERLSAGENNVQVRERGVPEVRALIRSFNAMAARLQEQSEQRQNLLAEVTHELRTPLTIIQGNIEGMQDGVYPRDEEHLDELLRETQRMSQLIEDLRILALAERGGLPIRKEPIDLAQLASEILGTHRSQAEAKGVDLVWKIEEDLPLVHADPLRIGQVLTNLMLNALHHTGKGDAITISIQSNEQGEVRIQLGDSGVGIPAEDLPSIFDRFSKSPESAGSGLGLAIVKSLVEAHDGQVTAASTLGEGTTITVILPSSSTVD